MRNSLARLLIGTILIPGLFVLCGCNKRQPGADGSTSTADGSQDTAEIRMQKHGDAIMSSSGKQEARAWLKDPKHLFFKADASVISKFVEDFYNAGAKQVLIADIEDHDGNQYAGSILVVLPDDQAMRDKLFDVGQRADICFGEDPVLDNGQRYLFYTPD